MILNWEHWNAICCCCCCLLLLLSLFFWQSSFANRTKKLHIHISQYSKYCVESMTTTATTTTKLKTTTTTAAAAAAQYDNNNNNIGAAHTCTPYTHTHTLIWIYIETDCAKSNHTEQTNLAPIFSIWPLFVGRNSREQNKQKRILSEHLILSLFATAPRIFPWKNLRTHLRWQRFSASSFVLI